VRGVLSGLARDERDTQGRRLADGVLEGIWGSLVQAGMLDVATHTRAAATVESSCLTLVAVLGATHDLPRLLPVVMAWLLPFLQPPVPLSPAGLWAPPLRVLCKVLARGAEEEQVGDEATWQQVTQVYDAVLEGTRAMLASPHPPQAYNPTYFLEAFALLRTVGGTHHFTLTNNVELRARHYLLC
jgi:hypothetical protein